MDNTQFLILLCFCVAGLYYTGISMWGWIITIITLYFINSKYFTEDQLAKLYYVDTPLSSHVIQHCKRLTEPFRPPYWARNTHVQTAFPMFFPKPKFNFKREILKLSDGGELTLDYGVTGVDSLHHEAPVFVALPGLNGDSDYVIYLCKEAALRGFRPVVFNKRGLAGSQLATPKLQSFGDASDFREVILFLRKSFPNSKIVAVGVSAGSGLLASYLGEFGASCEISSAVCNCPGYELKRLLNNLPQPYNAVMLYGLKQMLKRHEGILLKVVDVDAAYKANNLVEFEELVYCKIYNYKDMEEYYKYNEPGRSLETSVPPVLCINSADDPVCLEEFFPYDIFRQLPNAMLAVTAEGGHCGFFERGTWNRWADDLALDYIEATMNFDMSKITKNHVASQ